MKAKDTDELSRQPTRSARMPVLFVGHGNPMNAIEANEFSQGWQKVARLLPQPTSILCVSAHWETWGTGVTAMARPRTIHDFGGFPRSLYEVQYRASGDPGLAERVRRLVKKAPVEMDHEWGLDHGCWSVLKRMFPEADIPVVQLSLDSARSAQDQYDLARELAPLRDEGVLIIGSGNLVHNLRLVEVRDDGVGGFSEPFGFDWAIEASDLFKRLIDENRHQELIHYESLGRAVQLAIPTPEHYLPMLYAISLKREDESIMYFNDKVVAGSLTMTCLLIDDERNGAAYGWELSHGG